jgi:DNA helicase HerA-like ATPase
MDKPKLVIFIDEAHLLFQEASTALLQQIETIVKLIRSKGIGIFFCTQNPMDVPASVLAQLGLKVQHALRAFTAADRKTIKQTAENYPETEFYKTEDLITQLGIGEALVTMLNEKGEPTPLVHCMMSPPKSRMDILSDAEIDTIVSRSKIAGKYNQIVDSQSAYEILNGKLDDAAKKNEEYKEVQQQKTQRQTTSKKEDSIFDNPMMKQMGRTAASVITRGLLGVLGLGGRKRGSLF